MSRRTLGGGRVLGPGKSLSVPSQSSQGRPPSAGLLSPSPSNISLESGISTPPSSASQDLVSRVSLDNGDLSSANTATAASSRLSCPICNEEMVTLLQLNRHLDDAHKNLEDERQDEVKDWFKTQMVKAKRFQPLAVLNQKLKGLDVFESNEADRNLLSPRQGNDSNLTPVPSPRPLVQDPDEIVSREHWQRRGFDDVCAEPMCGKRLNTTNGSVNCRYCGKLFCEEHTMYQMKLSRSAQHEPVRGIWCRVCETCYKSRDGYNDKAGFFRDHTTDFKALRQKTVDKNYLEVSRLEKRLTRLTQLLANPPSNIPRQATNKRWSLSWNQLDPVKALEQSVVGWQEDSSVSYCPYCHQDFSTYTFRRHHCRTCGKVVCGDPATGCSLTIGLNVETANTSKEKPEGQVPVDVRLCKDCNTTLFSRRNFESERMQKPLSVQCYDNLVQFERGIRMLLPRFQKLLSILQDSDQPPTAIQLAEAAKVRKRLIESFTQYDTAARRMRDLPADKPSQKKLQSAVYQQASNFLHLHMLPLKTLPKILKHNTSDIVRSNMPNSNGRITSSLASASYANNLDSSSQLSSEQSSQISAMEAEEKQLRERLIVLEEQKFFVQEMVAHANKRRRFDEVAALAGNVEEISQEIDGVQNMLSGLDFESAYTNLASPRPKPLG